MSVARLPAPPNEHESLAALFQRLATDVGEIVRVEIALLQLRFTAALRVVKGAGGGLVVAAVLGVTGFAIVMAGVVVILATVLPVWLAAFAVGVGLLVVAAILVAVELRVLTHGVNEALAPVDGEAPAEEKRHAG
jgi:hypothetical protein